MDEHYIDKPCQLCGVNDGKVTMWCGGSWAYAHEQCAHIAAEGIDLYLKHQVWFREKRGMQYSQQRGWFCENCKTFQYMSDGRECIHCGGETILAMTYHSSEGKANAV